MNDTVRSTILAAILLLPVAGAVAALPLTFPARGLADQGPGEPSRGSDRAVLRLGLGVTGAVLLLSLVLAAGFDRHHPDRMQATTNISWISALNIRIHLGVDGISLPLLVLTTLLTFLCLVYTYFNPPAQPRGFVALLLLLETGMIGTFVVLDLLLFFLAFDTVLIPMYFLIARWGGAGRGPAAFRFILYTMLGSVVMLLGLLLIGIKAGTFDMVELANRGGADLTHPTQILAVLAIGVGLAVKAPMWPLHSWLPDAHTAAPTVGSVLLAGVLLKMGTYAFVRIILPIAPDGITTLAPYLGAFAVVGIVYGALACLSLALPASGSSGSKGRPCDLKRLIAYSSIGHMGFVLLGIATLTPTGVNGALFANIAHGLITGLLFFLVGGIKERYGSTDLGRISGAAAGTWGGGALYARAPHLGGLLAFGAVASLGQPGLAGFWGELWAMFGAFRPNPALNRGVFLVLLAVAAFGTLLTAGYFLVVVRRVCMGEPPDAAEPEPEPNPEPASGGGEPVPVAARGAAGPATAAPPARAAAPAFADVKPYEFAAWTPLVALTVLAGLWPAILLSLTNPAVQSLLGGR